MSFESLSTPVIIILSITSLVLLLIQDWRVVLAALGIQYSGVFILIGVSWPIELAAIILLSGGISVVLIGIELARLTTVKSLSYGYFCDHIHLSIRILRFFLAILIGLSIYTMSTGVTKWLLGATYYQVFGGLLLAGMGIVIMGITNRPLRIIVGLLTFLSGFEILFATFDSAILITGFISTLTLLVALFGVYFFTNQEVGID
jgi:hypothetical protein